MSDQTKTERAEAVRGQPEFLRQWLRGVSPTNYRQLPVHFGVILSIIRDNVAEPAAIEPRLSAVAKLCDDFVRAVDDLGHDAVQGDPRFDAAGQALLAGVNDLGVALAGVEPKASPAPARRKKGAGGKAKR
jgi:hypothetical protein